MRPILVCVYIALYFHEITGHGMMLDPPNRSSLWRYNSLARTNLNDNENFCGGFGAQYGIYDGKCGVCGDRYSDPHPQDNENTGKYGLGIIAGTYESGSVINITVLLTANHLGQFTYSLCELKDPNAPESGEECFQDLLFEDGSSKYIVSADDYYVYNRVQLPNIKCERCVLRWTYKCGDELIGPHFLPSRLSGQEYRYFLEFVLPELLQNIPLEVRLAIWLMHDGFPPYLSIVARYILDEIYGENWIGRTGPQSWTSRSPDLNPLNFFLWGHLKSLVYKIPTKNEKRKKSNGYVIHVIR